MKCACCERSWYSVFDSIATPEKLAELLAKMMSENSLCEECPAYSCCMAMENPDGSIPNRECKDIILKWLKSDAPRRRRRRVPVERKRVRKPADKIVKRIRYGKKNK